MYHQLVLFEENLLWFELNICVCNYSSESRMLEIIFHNHKMTCHWFGGCVRCQRRATIAPGLQHQYDWYLYTWVVIFNLFLKFRTYKGMLLIVWITFNYQSFTLTWLICKVCRIDSLTIILCFGLQFEYISHLFTIWLLWLPKW